MSIADMIRSALLAALPESLHVHVPYLAGVLSDVADDRLDPEQAQERLADRTGVALVVQELAGRRIGEGRSLVSFGHHNEFGDVTIGDVALGSIVKVTVAFPRPAIGIPFQAPPLPPHFVARPEVTRELKAKLLEERATPGTLVVSAVHGLGGIGKSTLAAHLARDPEVLARFPDGVLWATLGQHPDLLSLLSGWVQALGDYELKPLGVETASKHLATLLHQKAVLLVVDDAWDPGHVRPFCQGGPRCRVLVMTRDALIAKAVDAALFDLGVLTQDQALALLAGRLDRDLLQAELDQARELAEAVGFLPLALELSAAQAADGVPWSELLKDLTAEIARLESLELPGIEEVEDEATRKRLNLRASFHRA
jgi:hypothetical protein